MYLSHGLDDRQEQLPYLLPGQRAGLLQFCFQGNALDELHHDIGRAVLLKQIQYPNHSGDAVSPGHFPGFLQEHLHSVPPGLLCRLRGVPGQIPGAGASAHLSRGVILLHSDFALQRDVPADVGNAEAPLAENLADQVFPRQNGSRRQGIFRIFCRFRVIAAPRTGIALKGLHTAQAFR